MAVALEILINITTAKPLVLTIPASIKPPAGVRQNG
jgi:hypothetical protein